jgi:hypothetical protein
MRKGQAVFPERIILSRKGFDKGTGELPSPILPDGSMLSLPIPQYPNGVPVPGKPTAVTTHYRDLQGDGATFGDYLARQTARRRCPITGETIVHLDPDLRPEFRPYNREVPMLLFGQELGAQGHLRNVGVGKNDLFLFYGYFKPCLKCAFPELCREPIARQGIPDRELHVIWGWLQVKNKHSVTKHSVPAEIAWAKHHPHVQQLDQKNNCVYIGTETLSFRTGTPGAGVFPLYDSRLLLSDLSKRCFYEWREEGELSFLKKRTGHRQEHVLHVAQCGSEIVSWVNNLFDALKQRVKG